MNAAKSRRRLLLLAFIFVTIIVLQVLDVFVTWSRDHHVPPPSLQLHKEVQDAFLVDPEILPLTVQHRVQDGVGEQPADKSPVKVERALSQGMDARAAKTSRARVCTRRATVNMLAVGDWGGMGRQPYRTPISTAVAHALGNTAQAMNVSMVLALGDAFYPHGVQSVNDFRFRSTFEEPFSHPALQVPWFLALGNHDYEGQLKPLMEYGKKSRRWNLPDLYYSKTFYLRLSDSTTMTYQILFLDTNRLVRQFNRLPKRDTKQWDWIGKCLKQSRADWIFVIGHHPIYSVSKRGTNAILVNELLPMLHRHGVALYLSGHDHDLQHIRSKQHVVDMFVIGSGSYMEYSTKNKASVPDGYLKMHRGRRSFGGFASLSLTACTANLVVYEVDSRNTAHSSAEVVYTHKVMNPRKKPACCMPSSGT